MDAFNYPLDWYFSEEGKAAFAQQQTLEDRSAFLQGYLLALAKDKALNRMCEAALDLRCHQFAFFLADAVYGSVLSFAAYPALIDPKQNPFLGYWQGQGKFGTGNSYAFYEAFSGILNEQNIFPQEEDNIREVESSIKKKIAAYDSQTICGISDTPDIPEEFDFPPSLRPVLLKIKWFCKNACGEPLYAAYDPVIPKEKKGSARFFIAGIVLAILCVIAAVVVSIVAPPDRSKFGEDTDGSHIELELVNWDSVQAPLEAFDLSIENKLDKDLSGLTIELQFYDSDDQLLHTTSLPLTGYMAAQSENTINVKLHDDAVEDLYWYPPEELGIVAEIKEIDFNDTFDDPAVKNGTHILKEAQKPDASQQNEVAQKLDAAFALFDAVDLTSNDFQQKTAEFGLALDEIWSEIVRSEALLKKVYNKAEQYEAAKEYEKAYMLFGLLASQEYADSASRANICASAAGGS